ncbi:MAG: methyltransferase domain-containing protein [Anaerolineae bacterium]|nr:methyltransferase domain-containing protein [Anaerolineae bacterium]
MLSEKAVGYFEFLASLGLTKHLGSMQATRQLIELCRIRSGQYVLDVGCGVGATPHYLARAIDCRVVGVDLLEAMIAQARARTTAAGVQNRVKFAVADVRNLPFAAGLFDAVIAESVLVFFDDKREVIGECARVTRRGGYVGITEMTWLGPPAPEAVEYYRRVVYADALQAGEWIELLQQVGLEDVTGNAQRVNIPQESRGRFERYGCRGIMQVLLRTLVTLYRDRTAREFMQDVTGSLPKDMMRDMGYGVYAGRKE